MKQYQRVFTKQFRKDVRRLKKSGHPMRRLEEIIDILATNGALPQRCRDHELHGALAGQRECHIAPDWLLLYRKDHDHLILLLLSTGTHRDVLGIE